MFVVTNAMLRLLHAQNEKLMKLRERRTWNKVLEVNEDKDRLRDIIIELDECLKTLQVKILRSLAPKSTDNLLARNRAPRGPECYRNC